MLHLHFGAGRLGLGLVAPFFRTDAAELILLNRSVSRPCEKGGDVLTPRRRNELLLNSSTKNYCIKTPGGAPGVPQQIQYDRFMVYDLETLEDEIESIVEGSSGAKLGVTVSASLLLSANYIPVLRTLNKLSTMRRSGAAVGPLFFVACENSFDASDVLADPEVSNVMSLEARSEVICVHALVDRLCVALEEVCTDGGPMVCARAELYGSLKLESNQKTELLQALCGGSRVEFTPHVEAGKQIKIWLLNGCHWLLALAALESARGNPQLNLNQYLSASDENEAFARSIMSEMKEGVEIILRTDSRYAAFARDVDVRAYLDGAASAILQRFFETDDPLDRILARFRAPTSEAFGSIETFSKHFADRVREPMRAYEHKRGVAPPAASHSLLSMLQLVASGTFIEDRVH